MIKALKRLSVFIAGLALIGLLGGCSDFLSDPDLQKDPNRPVEVLPDQLFNGIQVAAFFAAEDQVNKTISMWMQQMCGTDRQFVTIGQYVISETDHAEPFENIYLRGGLVDIKKLKEEATERGWTAYRGMVKFYEAFRVGMGASIWGDIPYSEAVTDVETPKLDPQADVYAAVQALLDEAIVDLTTGEGYVPVNDFVFGGDLAKWVAACHSLKARLYMHWAEVDAANYGRALAAAQNGIGSTDGNFMTQHSAQLNEGNLWYQFEKLRSGYVRAGENLIELLKTRQDPRLEIYFVPDDEGGYTGARPENPNPAVSNVSDALNPAKSVDVLTWEETQLIIAECAFKTGDEATALAKLNETRRGIEARWGLDDGALGVAEGLTGAALIDAILEEKYIALFRNMEVYNDWKRTNRPVLQTFQDKPIPRRLYYSNDERNVNPNFPTPAAQPLRNANDPGDAY
ncbi:MAG TPA: SusD/RagB family nutrient-binding outer membrane lipoprotein [bacterium]|nr:SusD/RagB family nutrient-binding outer membrane lipoprotein [bacterium]